MIVIVRGSCCAFGRGNVTAGCWSSVRPSAVALLSLPCIGRYWAFLFVSSQASLRRTHDQRRRRSSACLQQFARRWGSSRARTGLCRWCGRKRCSERVAAERCRMSRVQRLWQCQRNVTAVQNRLLPSRMRMLQRATTTPSGSGSKE